MRPRDFGDACLLLGGLGLIRYGGLLLSMRFLRLQATRANAAASVDELLRRRQTSHLRLSIMLAPFIIGVSVSCLVTGLILRSALIG